MRQYTLCRYQLAFPSSLVIFTGHSTLGISIALGFDVYIRVSGLCSILGRNIAFPGETLRNLYRPAQGGLAIWDYKAGRNPFFEISSALVLRCLRRIAYSRLVTETFFQTSYRRLDAGFRDAMRTVCLRDMGFKLNSLRRRGATHSWLHQIPILEIIHPVRWASGRTCTRYLNSVRAVRGASNNQRDHDET